MKEELKEKENKFAVTQVKTLFIQPINENLMKLDKSIIENKQKNKLNPNTLFAYREDDHYFQCCDSEDQSDSYLNSKNHSYLNNSNFFSTVCDKSQWAKVNHEMNNNHFDNKELDESMASELLKSLGILDNEDDLNEAKISLNNDISSTNDIVNHHNYSTQINNKKLIDIDDRNTLNSSSFLNQMNCPTSHESSFIDERKPPSSTQIYRLPPEHTTPTKPIDQNYDFHAKSVDFTNNPNKLHSMNHASTNILNQNPFLHRATLQPNSGRRNYNIFPYNQAIDPFVYNPNIYKFYETAHQQHPPNHYFRCEDPEKKVLIDQIYLYIRDQNGCRILQKKIEEKNAEFLSKFYEKVENNLINLMNDQFGNYVCQKFFECCDQSFISKIINNIKYSLYNISTNCHGTRAFQRLLDFITNESDFEVLKEFFNKNIYKLTTDNNGNHVIQKLFYIFPKKMNQFIFDEITKHCLDIARLKLGGCVLQKALDNGNENQKKSLIVELIKNLDKLINDEFGNFVIQQIISMKSEEYNEKIFNYLRNHLITLSKLKYSSNVIDKCILVEDSKYRRDFIDKLISSKAVPDLITDQFGNYVIQKSLEVTQGQKFLDIINMIKPVTKSLKTTHHGKKIYEKLVTNYGEHFQNNTNTNKINNKNLSFTKK